VLKPNDKTVKRTKYKHFFFDFDGVIVDSFETCFRLCNEFAEEPVTREEYRRMHDGNIYELKSDDDRIAESVTTPPSEEHFYFKKFIPLMRELDPFVGVPDVLRDKAERGSLHVVTSSLTSIVDEFAKRHDIRGTMEGIYGADVHPSKVKKMHMIFDKYKTHPSECLFVTDTLGDLREAKKAGVDAVAVDWGFHRVETLKKGDPIRIVDVPNDLLDFS